jgi:hypothetical protein
MLVGGMGWSSNNIEVLCILKKVKEGYCCEH